MIRLTQTRMKILHASSIRPIETNYLRMKNRSWIILITLAFSLACDKKGNLNILSVSEDIQLGQQVDAEIRANPTQYPILSRTAYPEAYSHMDRIFNTVLSSDKVLYKTEFPWNVTLIGDDNTLNAFCTPGGYVYVYTGLIKYLDTEDELAGVIGHEISHADLRHTSRNITQAYGYSIVIDVLLGKNAGVLAEIALGLKDLSYSRRFEREADDNSVILLKSSNYQCNGAAGFFVKLNNDPNFASRPPQWLSTHPNPENRIEAINAKADKEKCSKTPLNPASYAAFKNSLP
jgi:predicted Zn-dependent protease